jgi:2-phospho-L-lactate/phosphoenolpyruvate guanylyltransferase
MDTSGLVAGGEAAGDGRTPADAVVVVPVKAFGLAKGRLSEVLDGDARAALARAMATRVVAAAAPLGVTVVCDDDAVADWARAAGAAVVWTPGLGLNGAVTTAVQRLAGAGVARAVVAHADLPFAADLAALADAGADEVLLVPDRRRDGTNVLSVPTSSGFVFSYGAGSFDQHRAECSRLGLRARVVDAEHLGWDVDEPADLDVPAHLGVLPGGSDT